MGDPLEILRHFVDYGQPGCKDFPIRCFVRFHKSGDTKWVSFWERSRIDKNQRKLEREDSPEWKKDEVLKECNPVENYVVQRLELLNSPSSESEGSDSRSEISNFPISSKRYYFTCYPQAIHCHYQSGEIKSIPNLKREEVECYYPENIVYYKGKNSVYPQVLLTCFNPRRVCIDGKQIKSTPDIITFDNNDNKDNYNKFIRYWRKLNDRPKPYDDIFKLSNVGDVAEIYLNHLNQSFVDEFVKREKDENKFPLFVHVKYASLKWSEKLESFINYANENPGFRLKFTPFTDSDWRIMNRQIADKLGNKGDTHNLMIKHFTDFGQHGHDFNSFFARCYVRYRRSDENLTSFWERKRNSSELEEERKDSPEGWKEDKVLKEAYHAERYVLRRLILLKKFSGDVFLYMNASPCTDCANELFDFVTYNNVNIHVKYTSFYKGENCESDLNQINRINNDDNLNLRITPFTVDDDDWKILNRALIDRIQNHTDNDTDNVTDNDTDNVTDNENVNKLTEKVKGSKLTE